MALVRFGYALAPVSGLESSSGERASLCISPIKQKGQVPASIPEGRFGRLRCCWQFLEKQFLWFQVPLPTQFLGHPALAVKGLGLGLGLENNSPIHRGFINCCLASSQVVASLPQKLLAMSLC